MEKEPTTQPTKSEISPKRWNSFSKLVQRTQEMLRPEDNPDILKACKNAGISERELYKVYYMLESIFHACYKDVFPPKGKEE